MDSTCFARAGIAVLLSLSACSSDPETNIAPSESIEMMALPNDHLSKCELFPELERACPRRIPMVEAGSGSRSRSFRSGKRSVVFFSEWSGPYPGITTKNAPPRFFHLNVHGGDLAQAFRFEWPTAEGTLADPIPRRRSDPILLETVSWSGKQGSLVLAPSFPSGGIDGDHLIFRWTEGAEEYAISIHAWAPLSETTAALKIVVGTLPGTTSDNGAGAGLTPSVVPR